MKTICGCTGAGMFGGDRNPCSKCSHANSNHNFGKGCRVTYNGYNYFLEDKDVDYTKFKRLMK